MSVTGIAVRQAVGADQYKDKDIVK